MRLRTVFSSVLLLLICVLMTINYIYTSVTSLDISDVILKIIVCFSFGALAVILLLIFRKMTFDYIEANFEEIGKKTARDPQSTALYAIALSIQVLAYSIVFLAPFFLL